MTYTHPLPNGGTLTTEISTASEASIKAGLAEVARVAALVAPVSQVDAVVGEQAVAILERLRDLLGVESMGAVEAEVELMRGPDVLTEWPAGVLPGLWRYYRLDDNMKRRLTVEGRWYEDGGLIVFVDEMGSRRSWTAGHYKDGERFERVREEV